MLQFINYKDTVTTAVCTNQQDATMLQKIKCNTLAHKSDVTPKDKRYINPLWIATQ